MNRLLGDSLPGSTAMQATIGGTIYSLSGGSFQNGAMTAAFAHLYNECQHGICRIGITSNELQIASADISDNGVFPATHNCTATLRCIQKLKAYEPMFLSKKYSLPTPTEGIKIYSIPAICASMNQSWCNKGHLKGEKPWPPE